MDLDEFYDNFITCWRSGDNTSPFVRKCRLVLVEEAEFFEMAHQHVRISGRPYAAYNQICSEMFGDGSVHMGRLCSLFAFSAVLMKTFPDIQKLLFDQLKSRRAEIEKLKKWE